ncbi:MAG TPA: S1 RNA-binding domain-containing protein, partial [Candidatus Acetothermia bacterium]|nr:S1 RNA-binding domain-containing protein [Candidatus Acetothermia bacterium]
MAHHVGELVVGKVAELRPHGALISLPQGEVGFLPAAEVADPMPRRLEDHLRVGQELVLKVVGFDRQGRPSLSLTRVTPRDREAVEYHLEVVRMQSQLAGRSLPPPAPAPSEERLEWQL